MIIEHEMRRLVVEIGKTWDNSQAWIDLSKLVTRVGSVPGLFSPGNITLHKHQLLEQLKQSPDERSLVSLLLPIIGVTELASKDDEPAHWWKERPERLGEAEDHWYDRVTGLPLRCIDSHSDLRYLLIPEGPFLAGEETDTKGLRETNLGSFLIAQYPVTRIQYRVIAGYGFDEDTPETRLNGAIAGGYLKKIHARLPTINEWEKAARGTDGATYPWGNDEPNHERANYGQNRDNEDRQPIESVYLIRNVSPFGLVNAVGNVSEVCWDNIRCVYVSKGGCSLSHAIRLKCGRTDRPGRNESSEVLFIDSNLCMRPVKVLNNGRR